MSDSKAKIQDRIAKLMAMANDGAASEGEVTNALKFARNLMEKHDIDEADCYLNPDEGRGVEIEDCEAVCRVTFDEWENRLAMVMQHICEVTPYFHTKTEGQSLHFVGTSWDVKVAKSMYEDLFVTIRTMSRFQEGPGWKVAHRSYCTGFVDTLIERVKDLKHEMDRRAGAIVLAKGKLIEGYIEKNLSLGRGQGYKQNIDRDSYARGQADGRNAFIGTDQKISSS